MMPIQRIADKGGGDEVTLALSRPSRSCVAELTSVGILQSTTRGTDSVLRAGSEDL